MGSFFSSSTGDGCNGPIAEIQEAWPFLLICWLSGMYSVAHACMVISNDLSGRFGLPILPQRSGHFKLTWTYLLGVSTMHDGGMG